MSFSGVAIIDAVLDTLRRDGVAAPSYTLDDTSFVFMMGAGLS